MSRHIYLSCISVVVFGLSAHAQLPAASVAASPAAAPVQHSLSMDVKAVGSGGTGKAVRAGFKDTTLQGHRTVLAVEVRNFNQHPDQAHVEWYFFGAGLGSSKVYVFDSSGSDITLQAGGTEKLDAASRELTTVVKRSMSVGPVTNGVQVTTLTREEGGSTVKGWLVRLLADGKVIQIIGSASKYEELGRHDADLQALKQQAQGQ
ncbi:MAG: hypothetical protein WCD79_22900 [Chthoniobacteraceae bacterium]